MPRLTVRVAGEAAERDHIVLAQPRTVSVTLLDDDGGPLSEPWRVTAKLTIGASCEELPPIRARADGADYELRPLPRRTVRPGTLSVTAARLAKESEQRTVQIGLWPGRLARLFPLITGLLAVTSLYIALLLAAVFDFVAQLWSNVPGWLSTCLVGYVLAGHIDLRRMLDRPLVRGGLTLALVVVALFLRSHMHVAVNHALEPILIDTLHDTLPAGDFAIVWRDGPPKDYCFTEGPLPCTGFPKQDSLLLRMTRLLGLPQKTVGCPSVHLPSAYHKQWAATGRCQPVDGVALDKVDPQGFFRTELWGTRPTLIAKLTWDEEHKRLRLPELARLARIRIEETSAPPPSTRFRMRGRGAIEELAVSPMRGGELLTPQWLDDPGTDARVLEVDVELRGSTVGTLSGSFEAQPVCRGVRTGSRLRQIVLQGTSTVRFEVRDTQAVSWFPLCWAGNRPPPAGELHLDGAWTPMTSWTLEIPAAMMPEHLSVLDSAGRHWGTLHCVDEPHEPRTSWRVGPIRILEPRRELRDLSLHPGAHFAWQASPEHDSAGWAWACWQGDAAPSKLFAVDRWSLAATDHAREYHSAQAQAVCYRCQDRSASKRCAKSALSTLEVKRWYEAYGPAHCDPRRSFVCECP